MSKVVVGLALGAVLMGTLLLDDSRARFYGSAQQSTAGLNAQQNAPQNVLIVLDASDSMNEKMGGQTKFQAAKDVVLRTVRNMPPNVHVGLRVYGHRLSGNSNPRSGPRARRSIFSAINLNVPEEACRQTELLVPIGSNNRASIATELMDVDAVGKTPISYSLREAVHDFAGVSGKKTIILVSDGRETCDFDPCEEALSMVQHGIDIKVNTIGFGTRDRVAIDQLKCVALSTKGKFYSADTAAQLAKSLHDSTDVQTSVQAKIYPGAPSP